MRPVSPGRGTVRDEIPPDRPVRRAEDEPVLVLDADQVPDPAILDRTVGYFDDPRVAIVQTPQVFDNVPVADPLGSQASLFSGPIMQGKDGWTAAFFCGSNAVLRRDALMQLGLVGYVDASRATVRRALRTARAVLARAAREAADPTVAEALTTVRAAAARALRRLDGGDPLGPSPTSSSAPSTRPPARSSTRTSPGCGRTSSRSPSCTTRTARSRSTRPR